MVAPISDGGRRDDGSATIFDIAREAGVSKTTVSRALTGSSKVAPDTLVRVLDAAARLDYRVNVAARSLRTARTFLVGLLVPAISNDNFGRIAEVIERDLRGNEMGMLIVSSGWEADGERMGLESLRSRGVDALVVSLVNDRDKEIAADLRSFDRPIVLLDRELRGVRADHVFVDHHRGVSEALEHLVGLGHSRIAIATITLSVRPGREAQAAYRTECARLGLDAIPPITVPYSKIDRQGGRDLGKRLVESDATAILALTPTSVTAGLLEYLEERRISVPDDMSMVAFDDSELAAVMRPQLTIVSRPLDDLARSASRLVASSLANPNASPRVDVVYPTLIVRGSTSMPQVASGARSK